MRFDPPPCPVCHDLDTHDVTAAVPEFSKYECDRCGHTWTDA